MSEMSGDEKDEKVIPDTNPKEAKKKLDLDDTISRLLRRKAEVDAKEGQDSAG